VSFVPDEYRWMVDINPFYAVIEPFRMILYYGDWTGLWMPFGKSLLILFILLVTLKSFWKLKKNELYISI
jgi:ABC-type polysaccharide/polyol phosphate export permease